MSSGRVWLTADTHFGHANIIGYCNRPFEDADEMSERLIRRWNGSVKPDDTVLHLGDFAFFQGNLEHVAAVISQLNGPKILVRGNHDKKGHNWFMKAGFDFSCDLLVIGEDIFTHYPVSLSFKQNFRLNFHGHHTTRTRPDVTPSRKVTCA
jgi:calcineurin-like phosphoesterase family protein